MWKFLFNPPLKNTSITKETPSKSRMCKTGLVFWFCWFWKPVFSSAAGLVGFYNYTKQKATHPAKQGITFRAGGRVEHPISINLAHTCRFIDGISRALLSARVEVQPCAALTWAWQSENAGRIAKKKKSSGNIFSAEGKALQNVEVQLFPKQCFVSSIAVHTVPWLEDLPCQRQVR